MKFAWRKQRIEIPLGLVADFCPICRDLRAFAIFRAEKSGELLGHVKLCKTCGLKLGTDPDQYLAIEPPTSDNLELLVARTYPGIWMKFADRLAIEEELRQRPGSVPPEARDGYLMEPFVLFNDTVEQCYGGKVPLDTPSKLGALATIALTAIIVVLAAMMDDPRTKDHLFVAMLSVFGGGTAFTLWQLYLRPSRYVRQKVIPSLALALKPLAPSHAELESGLEKCRIMRMKIGHVVKAKPIWTVLATPQALPKTISAAAPIAPKSNLSPMTILLSMLLLGGIVYCYSHFHLKALSERIDLAGKIQAVFSHRPPPPAPAANAVGFFIPAPRRVDMVYDPKRNRLYLSSGDMVLRYQLATHTFLPPLRLGGSLCGMDLSLDYNTLAVADAMSQGAIHIHLVNLETGAQSRINFTAEPKETGTFSVAFDKDGAVWITSTMAGGPSPLRKYQPANHRVFVIAHLSQIAVLAASANREYIAYAGLNDPVGNFGWFNFRAGKLQPPLQANASLLDVGINRDGSQLVLPNQRHVTLSGGSFASLEEKAAGVALHPRKDYVFLTRGTVVEILSTTNYSLFNTLDFGAQFTDLGPPEFHDGHLRLSADGKLIFCLVPGGVRYAESGL